MTFQDRLYPPKGLRVLVTAGGSGIGAAIASAFAETGAEIHVCDIDDGALAAFQKRIVRSPCVITASADSQATASTQLWWPRCGVASLPVATSQRRIVLALSPVITVLPSGEKIMA